VLASRTRDRRRLRRLPPCVVGARSSRRRRRPALALNRILGLELRFRPSLLRLLAVGASRRLLLALRRRRGGRPDSHCCPSYRLNRTDPHLHQCAPTRHQSATRAASLACQS